MIIGINGYETVIPRFGFDKKTGLPIRVGSGEYCFELLTFLNKIDKKNKYLIYLPTEPVSDMPKESENWHYKIVPSQKMWLGLGLSFEFLLKRPKLDVFFSPTHYLPFYCPYKSIVSVLDLSYLRFPALFKKRDLFQLKYWTKYSVKKAKKVITISKASKDDIIKEYGIAEDKIVVTYPGIKEELGIMNQELRINTIRKKYEIKGNYILSVGTLQPRKNIVRLIEAFSRISPSLIINPLSLIIVGKKGWMYEEILEAPKKFSVADRVKFLEFVSNEDLPFLYQNAECFVLPSLYEGFGLPVLETMRYGCPCVISNVSSLPEAGGDAALYFDPNNAPDITAKIEMVLNDRKLRKEMREKGYKQIKKFSWEKTARETLKVLEDVAKKI